MSLSRQIDPHLRRGIIKAVMHSGGSSVTLYRPVTSYSASIVRPHCIQCGETMILAQIEPVKPGFEKHTFECRKCEHSITHVAKNE